MSNLNKKLILGVTVGGSSRLLDGQAKYFKSLGYDVHLMSQDHFKEPLFCEREGIKHLPIAIEKEIAPFADLKTIYYIIKHLVRVKPDIVNLGTPKISLLGLFSAWFLRIPNRIYTCRGFRFETETGLKRTILIQMERLTIRFAKKVIYVSPSLLERGQEYKVVNPKKSTVIGKGSSNGVNLSSFNQSIINQESKKALVSKYNLEGCLVIGFVGRVSLHKGTVELVHAFEKLYEKHSNLRLIMMGHIACDEAFKRRFESHPAIIPIPFQDDVPLYMSLFDIFVLPSWREGFPNVPIQAAAMGIPVVVSNATGCVDSVKEGFNGKIYPVKNESQLKDSLLAYVENKELREVHGQNGIVWAKEFQPEIIWNGIEKIYNT
jgi:glycosyltransferase involved in cell wall biosynthesis